ncbi:unnamed protein product [Pedinophyceae sp. YPF-701]|nr:unnamed protein product [Pedinophyceae sp. YPF-701]
MSESAARAVSAVRALAASEVLDLEALTRLFLSAHGRLVAECLLVVAVLYLLLVPRFRYTRRDDVPLTEAEIDQLCAEWQPQPLAPPPVDGETGRPDDDGADAAPLVSSPPLRTVIANGRETLNFGSANFLMAGGDASITERCIATISKYGTGACGPRGFYGTIDVHLELEGRLAAFLGQEACAIYSYDVATPASVIPAFARRGDVIMIDESCSWAIQQGCALSRATVVRYKHNDAGDLEARMADVERQRRRRGAPLTRRFVIAEGINACDGTLAPLPEIVRVKDANKYRLIVDESLSLGVLGAAGRGALEHWGLSCDDATAVVGSMGTALGSMGGFCVGKWEVVDHQRINASGYVFSAALPPFLATAAIGALDLLESPEGPARAAAARANAQRMRSLLRRAGGAPGLRVVGGKHDDNSPVVHLVLDPPAGTPGEAHERLTAVRDGCLKEGVLVAVARRSRIDAAVAAPSLKVMPLSGHSDADLQQCAEVLAQAARDALASKAA